MAGTATLERPSTSTGGVNVSLRPVHPEDLGTLESMLREPEIARWWGMYDDERVRAEFLGDQVGVFVIEADGEPAGAIEYVESTDPDYKHAQIDLFVTERMRNQGIATTAVSKLVDHLFVELGHHRVVAAPGSQNAVGIRLFEDVGFKRVGILHEYEKQPDGSWGDNVLLELVQRDFAG